MGVLTEKAENAFAVIESGLERLSPERDGLITSLYEEDLERLAVIGLQICTVAANEIRRRREV